MKNIILPTLTLAALALAPFAEAAYMEGGKPVTFRHAEKSQKSVSEAPEKTSDVPAEAAKESSAKTVSETQNAVPEIRNEKPAEPVPAEKSQKSVSESPEKISDVPAETAKESSAKTVSETQNAVPEIRDEKPAESVPAEKAAAPEKPLPEIQPEKVSRAEPKPPPQERFYAKEDFLPPPATVPAKRECPKNTFAFSAFCGEDINSDFDDLTILGIVLGYERILGDLRCDECGLGNVLSLVLNLGIGGGDTHEDNWNCNRECEVSMAYFTFGLNWRHQLGRSVALSLGAFVGIEFIEMEWEYHSWWSSYSYSNSESDSGLCLGLNASFIFDINEHHAIEIGVELYNSTVDFGYEGEMVRISGKLGYRFSF